MKKILIVLSLAFVLGCATQEKTPPMPILFGGPNGSVVQPVLIVPPPVEGTDPTGFTVGTNSTMLAPPRNISGAPAWVATGGYKNGSLVSSGTKLYWNVALNFTNCTPVSATGPTHLSGDVADAGGGIIWRRFYTSARQGIDVVNETVDCCWLSVSAPASVTNGILLTTRGSSWSPSGDSCQEAVYAIATGTVHVVVQER